MAYWLKNCLFLASIIGLYAPPFFYTAPTTGDYVVDLLEFRSPVYADVAILSWIFIATLLFGPAWLLSKARNYLIMQFDGLSVLECKFYLTFEDESLATGQVKREEVFFANKKGVHAYHFRHEVSLPGANALADSIIAQTCIGGTPINQKRDGKNYLIITPRPTGGLDVIEQYAAPLPTSLLTTLLPNTVVFFLYRLGLFKRILAERSSVIQYEHEFNRDLAIYQVSRAQGSASNIELAVRFPDESRIRQESLQGMIISGQTVVDLVPKQEVVTGTDGPLYSISAASLNNATLRLMWQNPSVRPSHAKTDAGHSL